MPPELLIEILVLTLSPYTWKIRDTHLLGQVCRRWAVIVLASDRFWPLIDNHQSKREIEIILKRNPTGPMAIRHHGSLKEYPWRLIAPNLAAEASRWTTIICPSFVGDFREFTNHPMPNASEFYIKDRNSQTRHQILLGEGVPVRAIELGGAISIKWDSSRLIGLEILKLHKVHRMPSPSELYAMLSHSPKLRRLGLHNCDEEMPSLRAEQIGLPLLNLSALEVLTFGQIPDAYTFMLSRLIKAPNVKYLHVDMSTATALIGSPSFLPTLQLALARQPQPSYDLKHDMRHGTIEPVWHLCNKASSPYRYLHGYSFQTVHVPYHIWLVFDSPKMSPDIWEDLASAFDPTHTLAIDVSRSQGPLPIPLITQAWHIKFESSESFRPLIDYLSRTPCPRLTLIEHSKAKDATDWLTKKEVIEALGSLHQRRETTIISYASC